ncbi:class I glutamine amidotransferase-like protein [Halteromyces radiatus]|uniref:class I glutamine amidotransferase-like protein n=1 Tax=Halteromyces radiatus TaxID=101107 RepID=UPI0022203106|nr:class I glutamine amidotransferase-like protein [Halteromyces radiatus]KAI8076803.1 class I glutamine amidotransferase-like protein [Halteromyces radiatus]
MTKLHLALLVCDTPKPQVLEKHGDYPHMFSQAFAKAVSKQQQQDQVSWEYFDVVHKQEYPTDTSRFDAIVLTGSAATAYQDEPWILKLISFIQEQMQQPNKKKLVGICFGHQIIALAAGGKCGKNPKGWELGYYEISLTPFGKQFFHTDKQVLRLNQVHQDHVTELPIGFQCLATTSPHTPIHSMVSNDGQCITIQGHPEFNRDTVRILLNLRADAGVISRDFADLELGKLDQAGPDMEDTWLVQQFIDFIQGKLSVQID